MQGGGSNEGVIERWTTTTRIMKFKFEWSIKRKHELTAVDGMLHDDKQEVWATFLGPIGINDSNKAEYIPT